ncbi:MAG: SDR family NAD(P)-dependent oxidoreductase [Nevskia sp.]|nr:SDR family NAD(P)-dependent oxidoreductase [Nevskia sp.]
MQDLNNQRALVTGGSSGLGLGVTEALVARGAKVMVVARDTQRLAEVESRLGVTGAVGDVTDRAVAVSLLQEFRPTVLVLNAGAHPPMGPLHELSWDSFSGPWNNDVKAGFHWLQEALRLPLAPGSRVLISSSGAAVGGSPMSGGYAGAKRMLWFMASYANVVSTEQNLGIRFQALVLQQMTAAGGVGRAGADAYSRRKGVTREQFLAGFGKPLSAGEYGDYVARILSEPQYQEAPAYGIKGDSGIVALGA